MPLDQHKPKNYRRSWNGDRNILNKPLTAAEWNAVHKPGVGVLVVLDDGSLWHTKTRSEAWNVGDGQPVVMLDGKSGGYSLSRVAPMERQDTPLA